MLDLVVALGPYLRSSQEGGGVQADRGPLGWAPVRLHLPAGAFEFTDGTGGQVTYGAVRAVHSHDKGRSSAGRTGRTGRRNTETEQMGLVGSHICGRGYV